MQKEDQFLNNDQFTRGNVINMFKTHVALFGLYNSQELSYSYDTSGVYCLFNV